jgi:hypothetical protein
VLLRGARWQAARSWQRLLRLLGRSEQSLLLCVLLLLL